MAKITKKIWDFKVNKEDFKTTMDLRAMLIFGTIIKTKALVLSQFLVALKIFLVNIEKNQIDLLEEMMLSYN